MGTHGPSGFLFFCFSIFVGGGMLFWIAFLSLFQLLLTIGYWLLVIDYWLWVVGYGSLVIGYGLCVIGYELLVMGFMLLWYIKTFLAFSTSIRGTNKLIRDNSSDAPICYNYVIVNWVWSLCLHLECIFLRTLMILITKEYA